MISLSIQVRLGERSIGLEAETERNVLSLTGRSGVGKTTVLHCVAGLVRPDVGRIVIDGQTLFDSESGIDVPVFSRAVGLAFQDARLFPHHNVERNLRFGRHSGADLIGFAEVVDQLNLADLLHRFPRDLSGGETRRVAIGRALLSRPDILLLDEPLAALDAVRAAAVLSFVERLREAGVPILHVSHDPAEIRRIGGEVVLMTG